MPVYLIQAGIDGPIKIGFTKNNPLERLAQLQTAIAQKLSLLAVIPGDLELEAELHQRFSYAVQSGEWFYPVIELVEFAKKYKTDIELSENKDADSLQAEWIFKTLNICQKYKAIQLISYFKDYHKRNKGSLSELTVLDLLSAFILEDGICTEAAENFLIEDGIFDHLE